MKVYIIVFACLLLVSYVYGRFAYTHSLYPKYALASQRMLICYFAWKTYVEQYNEQPSGLSSLIDRVSLDSDSTLDPFSENGSTLRTITIDDKSYIYSIGPDGVDSGTSKLITNLDWHLSGDYCLLSYDKGRLLGPRPLVNPAGGTPALEFKAPRD